MSVSINQIKYSDLELPRQLAGRWGEACAEELPLWTRRRCTQCPFLSSCRFAGSSTGSSFSLSAEYYPSSRVCSQSSFLRTLLVSFCDLLVISHQVTLVTLTDVLLARIPT